MWQLFNAFSAEQQAIAIYSAQVFWRPGGGNPIFREVLAEEKVHRLHIEPFVDSVVALKALVLFMTPFNMLMGWVFGTLLSLLPRKLCYRVHVWAEESAAKTYKEAAKKIPIDAPQKLRDVLAHAALQELAHARRFEALLKNLS